MSFPTQQSSTLLRQLLREDGPIVAPGVYDGISARLALEAGFNTLYMSGASTTASMLGQPDLAIATQNDFVQNATTIAGLCPGTPLICDADTGFGGPVMVARTVTAYARAGVAGLHIEDQVQAKRCGHLLGKQIAPLPEFIARIRAAAAARSRIPGCDIVLIARTDAAQGMGMDEALERLKAAVAAGADVAFLEGVRNREDVERTVMELAPTPVLLNIVHGGSTPDFTVKEAQALGVKLVIFPLISAVPAIHGIRAALHSLKSTGSDVPTAKGMGPKQFFEVMGIKGLNDAIQIDKEAGGTSYQTSFSLKGNKLATVCFHEFYSILILFNDILDADDTSRLRVMMPSNLTTLLHTDLLWLPHPFSGLKVPTPEPPESAHEAKVHPLFTESTSHSHTSSGLQINFVGYYIQLSGEYVLWVHSEQETKELQGIVKEARVSPPHMIAHNTFAELPWRILLSPESPHTSNELEETIPKLPNSPLFLTLCFPDRIWSLEKDLHTATI
ncbi:Pyruvate/Phosphoenolpyruvate kinase-like domain-containing protein [Crucibulum laeve]|uniref:Pyruvate/Phosphoenolpyruvate kinase-like domain-containing protein n=1 Tax=Crucibulum laeve TaxID=68775 RepID=A0A5C3M5A4_9AGAR|nr:Pyruvate/Phosphoenolpyruvate kinase-like domain-containing protein [Crucibulum laeve]